MTTDKDQFAAMDEFCEFAVSNAALLTKLDEDSRIRSFGCVENTPQIGDSEKIHVESA